MRSENPASREPVYLLVLAWILLSAGGTHLVAQAPVPAAAAQQPAAPAATLTLTVPEAIRYALDHYPAVRAALENYNAAKAGVDLARTSYLPGVNAVWQADRGTRNSVYGVLLPQFPTILTGSQGSVRATTAESFWMSGMGVLFSWEPFTFGFRGALMQAAQATQNRASAQMDLTNLGVATAVANGALAMLANEQRVKASQADVDRRGVFARSVHALVDAHLRPGADASRADAELAAARTQLILAQQTQEVARAALAQLLGIAGTHVEIDGTGIMKIPPETGWAAPALANHPAALVEQRTIQEVDSRLNVLNHSFYPHIGLVELTSGRGSGENAPGRPSSGLSGLASTTYNWEAGINLQLGISDYFAIRQRKKIEVFNRQREEALYTQTLQNITGQVAQTNAVLDGARRAAENTPFELRASRDSEIQARARFQAGVGTLLDVAEAQRLLVQAEIDDALARLSIWRALADLAAAQGNLDPFLNLAQQAAGGH
jgi:outer membrane protein